MRPTFLNLLALAALTACGKQAETPATERKTAAGEVLGGSISDEMLPLDTVQSQSPPLSESGSGGQEDADGQAEAQENEDGDAAPRKATPAAVPSERSAAAAPTPSGSAPDADEE